MQYTLPWSPCLVTLLVVSGCPGSDPIPDSDGDGWEDSNDCEPEDPAIHPGAEELCDGIDNDCDGELDEGCNAGDLDGDGYLLYGPVTAGSLASADAEFLGESPDDWAGFALWTAGDVDADGYDDLIIGAHQESTAGALAGAVYVVGGLGL